MQATSTIVVIEMNVEHFTLGHKKRLCRNSPFSSVCPWLVQGLSVCLLYVLVKYVKNAVNCIHIKLTDERSSAIQSK